jgi:hypothetical protein
MANDTPRRMPFSTNPASDQLKEIAGVMNLQNAYQPVDAGYQKSNKYKYGKAVAPEFNGAEVEVFPFITGLFAYCDLRGIPNFFHTYLLHREMPERFSQEHEAADREIYALMEGWLKGTAHSFATQHLMDRSAHVVFKDIVDRFLTHSNHRRNAVKVELSLFTFRDVGHAKESIPQFFVRLRNLALKYHAVGGTTSGQDLVTTAQITLSCNPKYERIIDGFMSNHDGNADTFALRTRAPREAGTRKRYRENAGDQRRHEGQSATSVHGKQCPTPHLQHAKQSDVR